MATTALLISIAAFILSFVTYLNTRNDRTEQRQLSIGQKRTECLVALHEIELALEPSIRNVENALLSPNQPTRQRLQQQLDRMKFLLEEAQRQRNQLADEISPRESSHDVLLTLVPKLAELQQIIKDAHALNETVQILIAAIAETQESKEEP